LPDDWKSLLRECNFELARRELKTFFEISNAEAASSGERVCYREEFVNGWHLFANNPQFETAVDFIEDAPEYAPVIFSYLIECCSGGRFALYDKLLPP
jgi:hypothetical protein